MGGYFDPQFWIDPAVYPFLVKWCNSTGWEVKTNEPRSILYQIACLDGIRCRELRAEGKPTNMSREKAECLINDFRRYVGNKRIDYCPDYHPLVKVHSDFYQEVFLPALGNSAEVVSEEWGIFTKIREVKCVVEETEREGEVFIGRPMDRNELISFIRELENEALMAPYAVTYNLLRKGDRNITSITWSSPHFESLENAEAVKDHEKTAHFPGNWRIYQNVTDLARSAEFLPSEYVRCEGWLWLRVYHPVAEFPGSGHWEEGFFDNLGDLKTKMIEIMDQDMYAHFGIYASVLDDPLPEAAAPEIPITNVKDADDHRHDFDAEVWKLFYRVLKPGRDTGYEGESQEVAFGYCQDMETEEALEKLTAAIKDHVTLPPFMIVLYRMEITHEV